MAQLPAHILKNLDALNAMTIVQTGYEEWAAKPHNKKWVRMIEHTPIPNDLVVCIANVLRDVQRLQHNVETDILK